MKIRLNVDNPKRIPNKGVLFINVVILIFISICCKLLLTYNSGSYFNWESMLGWSAICMLSIQLISLLSVGIKIIDVQVFFLIFFYLFMYGQIILKGVLKIDKIESTGYMQTLMDSRYTDQNMVYSAVFILCCIQGFVCGFLMKPSTSPKYTLKDSSNILFYTGIGILILAVPCQLVYCFQMIEVAQSQSSYEFISSSTGLIDDFAHFTVPGFICLIFSKKLSKTRLNVLMVVLIGYYVIVMICTGDRRYQVVSIIVLVLAYIKINQIKFSYKYIPLGFMAIWCLNLLKVLRNIRYGGLVTVGDFLTTYAADIFSLGGGVIEQTLYEFGGSFYTVCLGLKFVPEVIDYRYGTTILSGIIGIIPLGFLYNQSGIFTYGRIAEELMDLGNTTVGSSVMQDLYTNFGWTGGIIVAIVCGLIISKIFEVDKKGLESGLYWVRYYTLFYAVIHIPRASFTEVIRTGIWGVAFLYLMYGLVKDTIRIK